jgi:hypothetical protein
MLSQFLLILQKLTIRTYKNTSTFLPCFTTLLYSLPMQHHPFSSQLQLNSAARTECFYVHGSPKNIKLILLVTSMNYVSILQERRECTELPQQTDQGSTTTVLTDKAEKTHRNIIVKDLQTPLQKGALFPFYINHLSLLL